MSALSVAGWLWLKGLVMATGLLVARPSQMWRKCQMFKPVLRRLPARRPLGGAVVSGWVAGQPQVSPEMEEATANYVEELKKLTDTLAKVSEQSARLTRDSEEMENLNRTLTGICKVYEMQLKGASSQIGTIDEINEQSRRMASQIEQLNRIYARMIEAMTVNMRATAANGNNAEV